MRSNKIKLKVCMERFDSASDIDAAPMTAKPSRARLYSKFLRISGSSSITKIFTMLFHKIELIFLLFFSIFERNKLFILKNLS